MCDMGTLSLGMTALGGVSSAIGAKSEASITKANYQYNATVGEFNAKLAGLRAEDAVALGKRTEQEVARGARRTKGAQVANMASSGIALSSLNSLSILAGTDVLEAHDIDTVKENTRKAVFAEEVAALEARTGSAMSQAGAAGISPGVAAGTSLINTTGQVADRWYKMDRAKSGEG